MGIQKLVNDKRGLEFKSAFFAVVAVGIFAVAMGVHLSAWNVQYNSGLDPDLEDFNQIEVISEQTQIQQDKLSTNDPDPGQDAEANTFRGVYGVLANIFEPFRVVFGEGGMLDSITDRFGIPDYVRQGIVIMMIAAITFALAAIIFRLGRTV